MKRLPLPIAAAVAALVLAPSGPASAAGSPLLISQEGLLLNEMGFPADHGEELQTFQFRLYAASEGGAPVWSEQHDLYVNDGYYSVFLGNRQAITLELLERAELWMTVQVGEGAEMSPRQRLVSLAYALQANVADNAVGDITPESVTTGGVLEADSGNVLNNYTVVGVVDAEDLTVRQNLELAGDLAVDGVVTGNLAPDTVESADVQAGAIKEPQLGGGAVSTRVLADSAVTTDQIQNSTVLTEDFGQDVLDAFENAQDGAGGDRPFVINADLLDDRDSSVFVRSDLSDSLEGERYDLGGLLLGSVGGNGGIAFPGQTGDAYARLTVGGGGSDLVVGQGGGVADALAVETQGGLISMRGGAVRVDRSAVVGGDTTVGGTLIGDGAVEFAGHGQIGGSLRGTGTAVVGGQVTVRSDVLVGGDLSTGQDLDVGNDLRVGNAARVTGTLTADAQITSWLADIVAQDGSVLADGSVRTEEGDVVAGGHVQATRAVVPAGGTGNAGVVWGALAGDPSDRAWLQHYAGDGQSVLELAVGDDGDDELMLASRGSVVVRDSDPNDRRGPGANLDVGGDLRVGRNVLFDNDMEVVGVVEAVEIAADLLTVETEVAVNNLLSAAEAEVSAVLRVDNGPNTAMLYADNITGHLANGMVTSNAIATGAVGRSHLSADAIHSGNVLDNSILTGDLADGAVTSGKIKDGTILSADLAENAILASKIGDGQVSSAKIRDGDVGAGDLASGAVTSDKLLDGQVKTSDLDTGVVTTDRLADNAVAGAKVGDGQLRGDAFGNTSIHGSKLLTGSVAGAQLQDGGVGTADLADDAVDSRVLGRQVEGRHVGDGTVKSADLARNAVTTSEIKGRAGVPGTIVAVDFATGAVTSAGIRDGAVASADIQDGAVATATNGSWSKLAANAVTSAKIDNGTITRDDLGFEVGEGGGGVGGAVDGNIEFPVKNKGVVWRDGEGGSEHWFLRRMDEHLVFLEPETGDTEHMRIRDGGGVYAPYGFDAGDKGVDGGGFRLKGKSVVQSDRDAFLKRLFLTDTDTSDSSSGGAGSVNFPKMRNGERPYLAVKEDTENGAKRDELHVYVGESSTDQLEVRAGGGVLLNHTRLEVQGTACDAPTPTPANPDPPCRNPANTPLFAIYDAKQKDDGWEEDAQKHVFSPYMAGLGGAHVNDDKEKILIGNQPQWGDAVYQWGKADFDNGVLDYGPNLRATHRWYNSNDWHGRAYLYFRNDTGNHSTWSYGNKETYCREDEATHCSTNLRTDYSRCWWSGNCDLDDLEATITASVVAEPSPPGTDGDGHNTHSLRLRSNADGKMDGGSGWGYAQTYQFWRLYWDPSDFPAGAIVAKASFWMRQREEIDFQPGYSSGNGGGTETYMWGMKDDQYIRGGGAQGNQDWVYYQYNWSKPAGVTEYDWQEVIIKGELLYEGNNVYLQSYNYARYQTIIRDVFIDTIEFSFLTANLSEMQVFADTKHWGSLHVLGELKVAGRKSFVHQHPTDPGKEITYVTLEGGEAGTYWRGSGKLRAGRATVRLPQHFALVTADEGITVAASLRGEGPSLYVGEVTAGHVVVATADGSRSDAAFDYMVLGVRKGYEDHVAVRYRQPQERRASTAPAVKNAAFVQ